MVFFTRYINLTLLILFPIAWWAPMLRAGWLPFFALDEISVLTGLQALWEKDIFLAVIVTFLALLEMMRMALIRVQQGNQFETIRVYCTADRAAQEEALKVYSESEIDPELNPEIS